MKGLNDRFGAQARGRPPNHAAIYTKEARKDIALDVTS